MIGKYIVFFLLSFQVVAQNLIVQNVPPNPVAGKEFVIKFQYKAPGAHLLDVEFRPQGITILDKKIKSYRNYLLVDYSAVANKVGNVSVSDITLYNPTSKSEMFFNKHQIAIIGSEKKQPDVFLQAEPDNTELFVNQAVRVRYYLYYKNHISSYDIVKFPKFENFQKRFNKKVNENPEQVSIGNDLYLRSLKYDVVLFPNKAGRLKIDPFELKVLFVGGVNRFKPSSVMGTKNIASKPVYVKIKELPPKPEDDIKFSGLLGQHKFSAKIDKKEIKTGEPFNISLVAEGSGYLEQLDFKDYFAGKNWELIDYSMDFSLKGLSKGKKVFNWSFIAKKPLANIDLRFSFYNFSLQTATYEKVSSSIGSINIAGEELKDDSFVNDDSKVKKESGKEIRLDIPVTDKVNMSDYKLLIKPVASMIFSTKKIVFYGLLIIVICLVVLIGKQFYSKPASEPMVEAFKNLKKKGLTYESLYRFLDELRNEDVNDGVSYIKVYIEGQKLPEQDIKYFQKLVSMLEGRKFSSTRPNTKLDIDFKPRLFKKLMKVSQTERISLNG